MLYFVKMDKVILKFKWKYKRLRRAKTSLEKNRVGTHAADSGLAKATVSKTTGIGTRKGVWINGTAQRCQK